MNELWWSCPHHDLSDSGSISTLFNYLLISANIFFMYLCRYTKIFVIFWTIYKIQHTVTETKIQIQRHSLCRVPLGCSLITQCLADLLKKIVSISCTYPRFQGLASRVKPRAYYGDPVRLAQCPRDLRPAPARSDLPASGTGLPEAPSHFTDTRMFTL